MSTLSPTEVRDSERDPCFFEEKRIGRSWDVFFFRWSRLAEEDRHRGFFAPTSGLWRYISYSWLLGTNMRHVRLYRSRASLTRTMISRTFQCPNLVHCGGEKVSLLATSKNNIVANRRSVRTLFFRNENFYHFDSYTLVSEILKRLKMMILR